MLRIGNGLSVQHTTDGQTVLFPETAGAFATTNNAAESGGTPYQVSPFNLTFDFAQFGISDAEGLTPTIRVAGHSEPVLGRFRYSLRPTVPKRFKTVEAMTNNEATEEDCANRFVVSARELLEAMAGRINVQRRTLEVFTHQMEFDLVGAELDPVELARRAEKTLLSSTIFDAKALRELLERKIATTLRELAMKEADDEEAVARFLDTLLARHPELLTKAQKAAITATLEVRMAEDLPSELTSESGLSTSARNVYGVYPEGLNTWEQAFATWLDGDTLGIVQWWHRNLPRLPWSVNVPLPDGRGFFPDFVVGINGRKTEDGALLADPKWGFDRTEEAPKAGARHPVYGSVLVLYRERDARWLTVRYDAKHDRACTDREFFLSDAVGFE